MRLLYLCLSLLLTVSLGAQHLNVCATETPDDYKPPTAAELAAAKNNTDTLLPTVYLEVDYDIVESLGGADIATTFIRGAFEEVAAIYRRDVTTAPQLVLFVHEQPSGYVATSSGGSLQEFRATVPNIPANVGMLTSFRASGGIAYVDQVCGPVNYSFSSLRPEYLPYDQYSWTVNVIGHELGHLFGSLHTQACVWNGTDTPLDGCWQPEGSCERPPVPQRGSMMSYCHLNADAENDLRILPQPASVMRARMIASGCVATKPAGPDGPDGPDEPEDCDEYDVTMSLLTDLHPRETSWAITNNDGQAVATSRVYAKREYLSTIDTTICLPAGCYDLAVTDPDGISSSRYFYGSYAIIVAGDTLATGGEFSGTDLREFCLGDEDPDECDYLDLSGFRSYTPNQDQGGTGEVEDNGRSITLRGNTWKAIDYDYTITPETMLEFEFKGGPMGEVHAIGMGNNNIFNGARCFRLGGSQNFGNPTYAVYPQTGGGWMRGRIPIGRFYTGPVTELFFINDKDFGVPNNISTFRNVRVHEGQCGGNLTMLGVGDGVTAPQRAQLGGITTYRSDMPTTWQLSDQLGRVVHQQRARSYTFRMDAQGFPTGVYYLSYNTEEGIVAEKIFIP